MEVTTKTFADKLGIDYNTAGGLLRALVALECAEKIGVQKAPGKKGKGQVVYKVALGAGARLDNVIARALRT